MLQLQHEEIMEFCMAIGWKLYANTNRDWLEKHCFWTLIIEQLHPVHPFQEQAYFHASTILREFFYDCTSYAQPSLIHQFDLPSSLRRLFPLLFHTVST